MSHNGSNIGPARLQSQLQSRQRGKIVREEEGEEAAEHSDILGGRTDQHFADVQYESDTAHDSSIISRLLNQSQASSISITVSEDIPTRKWIKSRLVHVGHSPNSHQIDVSSPRTSTRAHEGNSTAASANAIAGATTNSSGHSLLMTLLERRNHPKQSAIGLQSQSNVLVNERRRKSKLGQSRNFDELLLGEQDSTEKSNYLSDSVDVQSRDESLSAGLANASDYQEESQHRQEAKSGARLLAEEVAYRNRLIDRVRRLSVASLPGISGAKLGDQKLKDDTFDEENTPKNKQIAVVEDPSSNSLSKETTPSFTYAEPSASFAKEIDPESEIEKVSTSCTPVSQREILFEERSGRNQKDSIAIQQQDPIRLYTGENNHVHDYASKLALKSELEAVEAELNQHELNQAFEAARAAQRSAEKESHALREYFSKELDEIELHVAKLMEERDAAQALAIQKSEYADHVRGDIMQLIPRVDYAEARVKELEARSAEDEARIKDLHQSIEEERQQHAQQQAELQEQLRKREEYTASQLENQAQLMQQLSSMLAAKENALKSLNRGEFASSTQFKNSEIKSHEDSELASWLNSANDSLSAEAFVDASDLQARAEFPTQSQSQLDKDSGTGFTKDGNLAASVSSLAMNECIEEMSKASARLAGRLSVALSELQISRMSEIEMKARLDKIQRESADLRRALAMRSKQAALEMLKEVRTLKDTFADELGESKRRYELLVRKFQGNPDIVTLMSECVNKDIKIERLSNEIKRLNSENACLSSSDPNVSGTKTTSSLFRNKVKAKSGVRQCSKLTHTHKPHFSKKIESLPTQMSASVALNEKSDKKPSQLGGIATFDDSNWHEVEWESLAILEARNIRLETQLRSLSSKCSEAEHLKTEWETKFNNVEKALEISESDHTQTREALKRLEGVNKHLVKQLETIEEKKIEKVAMDKNLHEADVKSLRTLLSKRNSALDAARANEQALHDKLSEMQMQINKLEHQLTARSRLADLRGKRLESLEEVLKVRTHDDANSHYLVRAMKEKVKGLSDECVRREVLVKDLRRRLDVSVAEASSKQQEINALEESKRTLRDQLEKNKAENASRRKQLETLRKSLCELLSSVESRWSKSLGDDNLSGVDNCADPSDSSYKMQTNLPVDNMEGDTDCSSFEEDEETLCPVCIKKREEGVASRLSDPKSSNLSLRSRMSRLDKLLESMSRKLDAKERQVKSLNSALVVTRRSVAGLTSSTIIGQSNECRKLVTGALNRAERFIKHYINNFRRFYEEQIERSHRLGKFIGSFHVLKSLAEVECSEIEGVQDRAFRLLTEVSKLSSNDVKQTEFQQKKGLSPSFATIKDEVESVVQHGVSIISRVDDAIRQGMAIASHIPSSSLSAESADSEIDDSLITSVEQRLLSLFSETMAKSTSSTWQQKVAEALEVAERDPTKPLEFSTDFIAELDSTHSDEFQNSARIITAYEVEPRLSPLYWKSQLQSIISLGLEGNRAETQLPVTLLHLPDEGNEVIGSLIALVSKLSMQRVHLAETGTSLSICVASLAAKHIPSGSLTSSQQSATTLLDSVANLARTLGHKVDFDNQHVNTDDSVEVALNSIGLLTLDSATPGVELGAKVLGAGCLALNEFLNLHKQIEELSRNERSTQRKERDREESLHVLELNERAHRNELQQLLVRHTDVSRQLDVARHVISKLRTVIESCICDAGQQVWRTHGNRTPGMSNVEVTSRSSNPKDKPKPQANEHITENNDFAAEGEEEEEEEEDEEDLVSLSRALNDIGMA